MMSHIMMFAEGKHVGTTEDTHEAHDRYMDGEVDAIRVIQSLDEEPHVITKEPYPIGWITRPDQTPDFMAGREVNFSCRPENPEPVSRVFAEVEDDEEMRTPDIIPIAASPNEGV